MKTAPLQRNSKSAVSGETPSATTGTRSLAPPPFQLSASAPIQCFPIEKETSNSVEAVSGRPNAKSNKGTLKAIVQRIFQVGPYNSLEKKLFGMGKTKALNALYKGKFLSQNGGAICHKMAISKIESQFVDYTNQVLSKSNSKKLDGMAIQLVKDLTQLDKNKQGACLAWLKAIIDIHKNAGVLADKADDVANYLTYLIHELDGSASNLYVGYSSTNSSIGNHFDPHYNTFDQNDPSASPVSTSIYNSQSNLGDSMGNGHSSPRRVYDGKNYWNETSCVDDKGWVAYDYNANKKL